MQVLFAAAKVFCGGFDQGSEGGAVQRFGVLFVAAHGPRPDQRGLGLAVAHHGYSPAIVVFVFDDVRGPAVALPMAGFLNGGVGVGHSGFRKQNKAAL